MHGSHLGIKRSQSECLILSSRIYSPSPINNKKASRISRNVARELFDNIPPKIEEFEFDMDEASVPGFTKAKSCIFRSAADSSNEWSSESGLSGNGVPGECESPARAGSKNPLCQDSIFEDVSEEMPCRTSNPIVYDTEFRRYDKKNCGFPFYSIHANGPDASNL
jgi:hypothetical protein